MASVLRQMGPWLTALSYESTAYSGWLMLGLPGRAFKYGLAAVWVCVSCVLGDALNWGLVSRRLREETARLKALTIPEYLERRFQKQISVDNVRYWLRFLPTAGVHARCDTNHVRWFVSPHRTPSAGYCDRQTTRGRPKAARRDLLDSRS
jgi:hypothetical protein